MSWKVLSARLLIAASLPIAAACQETSIPTAPKQDHTGLAGASQAQGFQEQEMAAWFARSAPEVLALPQTVFADHDESAGRLVFGVEHEAASRGIEAVLTRLGIPRSAYQVKVTEPIHFLGTLRDSYRPTLAGIQIHFSIYVCTLGFNVDHSGGRSFITNSHCTDQQGGNDGTLYYQPTSSVDPNAIAVEADDPSYFKGRACPRGRKCRYSDAARALYQSGIDNLGEIARTSGANNGSLEVVGSFDITSQDNTTTNFAVGSTLNKVGRTTGWTAGNVTSSCATVNVAGSNITLLCQTLVEGNQQIVGGGDSGSGVFKAGGSNTAQLVGILWGGSSSGDLFAFSPLKNIQDELGAVDATTNAVGGGGNSPPTASFTDSCTGLTCDFDGSGSSDSDGTITSYDWDFGDGAAGSGVSVSHTYGASGTYTVMLTVTDDGGATGSDSRSVTVSDGAGGISLTATGYKEKGLQKTDLRWWGATSTNVDVYRDGGLIATTQNDGFYKDNIDQRGGGSHTYQVCEAGTSTCSNEATVTF